MLFLVPLSSLGADVCNPLPGFVPSYKTVGYEQSPGCRLHPEVTNAGAFLQAPDPPAALTDANVNAHTGALAKRQGVRHGVLGTCDLRRRAVGAKRSCGGVVSRHRPLVTCDGAAHGWRLWVPAGRSMGQEIQCSRAVAWMVRFIFFYLWVGM